MTENKRVFFVKKGGFITGPFTMTKLKLMVYERSLAGTDLFSTDKTDWRPVSRLFPGSLPETEAPAPESPNMESEELLPSPPPEPLPLPPPGQKTEPAPAPSPFPAPEEEAAVRTVPPWLRDLAALIVLPWEFEAEAPLLRKKKWKLVLGALILNLLPCALLLSLSCRQYAFRLTWPWAPLYAAGILLTIGLTAAAAARLIAVFRLPPGSTPPEEWKLLGIALFMDYGALCGTLMAFYPCFRNPAHAFAGALLSGMAATTAACAGTLLIGNFLGRFRAVPAKWAFLIVTLLTAGMAGMTCLFIEIIRN